MATVIAMLVVLLAGGAASAKGPSQAVIDGPGLAPPIALRDPTDRTIGPNLAAIVQDSGFWDGLWCRHCPSRKVRPSGTLGPRYTVRYTMTLDGRPSSSSEIVQYVYPYAEPHPVTYMPSGQPYWTNDQKTTGGWYVAKDRLRQLLIEVGLPVPSVPPTHAPVVLSTSPGNGGSPMLAILIVVGLAIVGAAVLAVARRRSQPRSAYAELAFAFPG